MRKHWVPVGSVMLLGLWLCVGVHSTASQQPDPHQHSGPQEHSFSDVERYAAMFESPERAAWQKPDQVIAALGVKPGMIVADIGAGTGYFAARFARVVGPSGTVFAADVEPNMVAFLRDRADKEALPGLIPVIASYGDPRLPDGLTDVIFICDTWHHISDRVAYARRLQKDLAPGGRVVIVDFLPGELPVGPPPAHKLSAATVQEEFEQAGFRLAATFDLLPYQYVLVFEPAAR